MKVLISLIASLILTSASHAAVTFSSAEVGGTINASTASFGAGEAGTASSTFGVFTHAFEIETASAADPLWANNPNVIIAEPNFAGSYSFTAATGYVITSIALRGGGNWATGLGGTVGATAALSANGATANGKGAFLIAPNNIPFTTGGTWDVQTSTLSFVGGVISVAGNIQFTLTGTGALSLIAGLDDAGILGGSLLGANFVQSAEAYLAPTILLTVSAVPEPSEWVLMCAGIAAVATIAGRRKSVGLVQSK